MRQSHLAGSLGVGLANSGSGTVAEGGPELFISIRDTWGVHVLSLFHLSCSCFLPPHLSSVPQSKSAEHPNPWKRRGSERLADYLGSPNKMLTIRFCLSFRL